MSQTIQLKKMEVNKKLSELFPAKLKFVRPIYTVLFCVTVPLKPLNKLPDATQLVDSSYKLDHL